MRFTPTEIPTAPADPGDCVPNASVKAAAPAIARTEALFVASMRSPPLFVRVVPSMNADVVSSISFHDTEPAMLMPACRAEPEPPAVIERTSPVRMASTATSCAFEMATSLIDASVSPSRMFTPREPAMPTDFDCTTSVPSENVAAPASAAKSVVFFATTWMSPVPPALSVPGALMTARALSSMRFTDTSPAMA
jgi:hypothetical protein